MYIPKWLKQNKDYPHEGVPRKEYDPWSEQPDKIKIDGAAVGTISSYYEFQNGYLVRTRGSDS